MNSISSIQTRKEGRKWVWRVVADGQTAEGSAASKWQAEQAAEEAHRQLWAKGCRFALGDIVYFEGFQWVVVEALHATANRPEEYRLRLVSELPFPSTKTVRLNELTP